MKLGSEDALVEWLRQRSDRAGRSLLGDDGAVIAGRGEWAVTVDHQIAGVHYPEGLDPALLARRLLAVNASDLAAMGARPRFAFLALAVLGGQKRSADRPVPVARGGRRGVAGAGLRR